MSIAAPAPGPISAETAKEIVRLSELYLDGTLRLSLAADTRALQMSGMLATAATVLLGFGLGSLTNGQAAQRPLALAAICCGALFFAAVVFAIRTIRPRQFNILGTLRSNWSDAELAGDLAEPLMSLAAGYETQARENVHSLSENARSIRIAYRLFVAALPASAVVAFLTYVAINGLPVIAN